MNHWKKTLSLGLLLILAFLTSCQLKTSNPLPTFVPTIIIQRTITPDVFDDLNATRMSILPSHTPLLAITPSATSTLSLPAQSQLSTLNTPEDDDPEPSPLTTPVRASMEPEEEVITATATLVPTATYWPTVTRQVLPETEIVGLVPCTNRQVPDDLLLFVSQQFSLPESYTPADLVLLTDYFENDIVLGQTLYVREAVIEPLKSLILAMHSNGLQPSIISAYRSYQEQALAWYWWNNQYPDRVAIMSARPGSSEHQLGTTIDFGSPALNHLFHVGFANTAEGIWLANNAYHFGFVLSYPENSYDVTGFKYEPWHYRYVGSEMAEQLFDSGQTLTNWQINNLPPPCIP